MVTLGFFLVDYSSKRCILGYQKTNADLTVDYFLKSLANHKIDLKTLEPDRDVVFRSCKGNEDGRFKISDIHENGTFLITFWYWQRRIFELQAISLVMTITTI